MSDMASSAPPLTDAGALLGNLLSNPDLIRNLSSVLGASNGERVEPATTEQSTPPATENKQAMAEGISRVLSNPEMMAKLPDVMKMLAPMMQQAAPAPGASVPASATLSNDVGGRDRRGCRNDLLLALKPFLSPERCRAIDMLLGLSRLGDALQKMV